MASSVSRYRRRLAAERDAAAVYRALASRRDGEERDILLALARAEERHAAHWEGLVDPAGVEAHRLRWRARVLSWLARRAGTLLVLALVQRSELRGAYEDDTAATAAMAADERVHARVVAGLTRAGRARASGTFRAAVFGVNDGLVSNVSLILGIAGAGASQRIILLTGLAGLLAGALSMASGEYLSVRSQRELLDAQRSRLDPAALTALRSTDVHELGLVFRADGVAPEEANTKADRLLADGTLGAAESGLPPVAQETGDPTPEPRDVIGSAQAAALFSFGAFAMGAVVPVLPYAVASGFAAGLAAALLAAAGLFLTGVLTGLLTGGPLARRGARQLAIGGLAAAVTYGLGVLFGVTLG